MIGINVVSVSELVRDGILKQNKGSPMEVYSVFSNAIYLKEKNTFIAIAAEDQGNFPYGVLVDKKGIQHLKNVKQKDLAVAGENSLLILPAKVLLDFSKAQTWFSPRLTGYTIETHKLEKKLISMQEFLKSASVKHCGFAFAARYLSFSKRLIDAEAGIKQMPCQLYGQQVLGILCSVQEKWQQRRYYQAVKKASSFIGLGPGLTPSGDDFFIGMMAAVLVGLSKFSPSSYQVWEDIPKWVCLEKGRTTEIGHFFLEQAMAGRFAERLIDSVKALYFEDAAQIIKSLHQLKKIGSSSGLDMATGVLFGGWLVHVAGSWNQDKGLTDHGLNDNIM